MKTNKTDYIISILLTFLILGSLMFLTLGSACSVQENRRVSAPIIAVKYTKSGKYIVMLEGRKAETIYANRFRITIQHNSKPALAYLANSHGKSLSGANADYEFIFSDHEQAKEYLCKEPGKNAQVYATAEATASGCFISTLMK